MNVVVMPPGKRPLPIIRQIESVLDRVEEYGKLLEWILVTNWGAITINGQDASLSKLIDEHAGKFSSLQDVKFSAWVYNGLKHAVQPPRRPPTPEEIARAARHLDRAITELLKQLSLPVRLAVESTVERRYEDTHPAFSPRPQQLIVPEPWLCPEPNHGRSHHGNRYSWSSKIVGFCLLAMFASAAVCWIYGPPMGILQPRLNGGQKDQHQRPTMTISLGNGVLIEFVHIPAGVLESVSASAQGSARQHAKLEPLQVPVSSFYLGKFEVTEQQWSAAMPMRPLGRSSVPVTGITWDDAVEFCVRASTITGRRIRLPNDHEWEYACRAGLTAQYDSSSNDSLAKYAWYKRTARSGGKQRVGILLPNAWGLFDMQGNVWEWCTDSSGSDPLFHGDGQVVREYHVACGGSYLDPDEVLQLPSRRWWAGDGFYLDGSYVQTDQDMAILNKPLSSRSKAMDWLGFRVAMDADGQ